MSKTQSFSLRLTLSLLEETFAADESLFPEFGVGRVFDAFAVLFIHQLVEAEDASFRGAFSQSVVLSLVLVAFEVQGMIVNVSQEPNELLVQLVARVVGDGSEISLEDIQETDVAGSCKATVLVCSTSPRGGASSRREQRPRALVVVYLWQVHY